MDRRGLVLGGMALILAGCSTHAFARGFRRRPGGGISRNNTNSYAGETLTRSELETCLRDEISIDASEQSLGQLENELLPFENQLADLGRQIDLKAQTLDRYSETAVDEYNAMVDFYENLRDDFNRRVDYYNLNSDEFNVNVERFNLSCGDKQYYEDDMLAARLAVGIQ